MLTSRFTISVACLLVSFCSGHTPKKTDDAANTNSSPAVAVQAATPAAECGMDKMTERDEFVCSGNTTATCSGQDVASRGCNWKSFCDSTLALLIPEEARPFEESEGNRTQYEVRVNDVLLEPSQYEFRAADSTLVFADGSGPAAGAIVSLLALRSSLEVGPLLCDLSLNDE